MKTAHEWLAGGVGEWWPSVADHLWQATIFAFIVLGASLAIKRGPARLRHSLWVLASVKFIVPAGLFIFMAEQVGIDRSWFPGYQLNKLLLYGVTEPASAFVNSYEITVVVADSIQHNEIFCVLGLIWLAGSFAFLGVWVMRRRKFFRALKEGRTMQEGREWEALERAKASLPCNKDVRLLICSHKTEPAVCRVWKPVVLLPQAIAGHLNDAELESIMLHELVHVQRRDNLVGNLQMIVCALLWFHPLVWFISSKLFEERELACDEEVLKIRGGPETYASSILKVVRFSLGWRVAGVTGAGSSSNLRRRIENIMSTTTTKQGEAVWHRLLAGTLVAVALILMVCAGAYTRSSDANAAVTDPAIQETTAAHVAESKKSIDPAVAPEHNTTQGQSQPAQPPQPPQAPQPAQLPQPALPPQPAQAPPPPQNLDSESVPPAAPSAPTAPTAAAASTPPTPPVEPAPPTREKTKSKNKDKQKKDDKDKIKKGGLIEAPPPVYPPAAKEQRVGGNVTVEIVINEDGNVISAQPTSGPELLHGAAKDAALKARFRPTLVDGKPAKVAGALRYSFVVDKD